MNFVTVFMKDFTNTMKYSANKDITTVKGVRESCNCW